MCVMLFFFSPSLPFFYSLSILAGGYYTIEQTKSRLRIIVLNTNFMRDHIKNTQTHSAAVRQRPGGGSSSSNDGGGGSSSGSSSAGIGNDASDLYGYGHGYGHHGGVHYRQAGHTGAIYGRIAGIEHDGNGGTVSALSGSGIEPESEKQWNWLEEVLEKSSRNKETVSAAQ